MPLRLRIVKNVLLAFRRVSGCRFENAKAWNFLASQLYCGPLIQLDSELSAQASLRLSLKLAQTRGHDESRQ